MKNIIVGIEESFKKKCKLLVEHIDYLKMKIEELKKSETEGKYCKYKRSICMFERVIFYNPRENHPFALACVVCCLTSFGPCISLSRLPQPSARV